MMHGKTSEIFHSKKGVFKRLPSPFLATRYHSLIIEKKSLPECLEITAKTKDGMIMGVRHKEFDCEGVQFHPESYATEHGKKLLAEFVMRKK
jgi:anthranilate synthase/aminodeoxychorismate synthase-like glutamine amidotransferase